MNSIIESLYERKSVRAFEKKDIDEQTRRIILECACQAPTAGNQQLYTIIDVRNQNIKDRLAVTCDNQPFIADAPMVLIFCADCKKWYDAYISIGLEPRKLGKGDLFLAIEDAMIAAQNAVVAAEGLGLGSCYIGDILENREIHKQLLDIPDKVVPIAMLVIGYPTEAAAKRKKPERAPLESVVHADGYKAYTDESLRAMLIHSAGVKDYEQWLTAFCKRKYDSEFSREMMRSVDEYLKEYDA